MSMFFFHYYIIVSRVYLYRGKDEVSFNEKPLLSLGVTNIYHLHNIYHIH